MFQHDEDEYKKLNTQLRDTLNQAQALSLEKLELMMVALNDQYGKCQTKLQELKTSSEKSNLKKEKDKVNKYSEDLRQSKQKIDKIKRNVEKQKNKLEAINNGQVDDMQSSMLNKNVQSQEMKLATTQQSNYTNIVQISQLVHQGNAITDNTIQNLSNQKNDLDKIQVGINEVDENLTLIDRLRRVVSNKAMLEKLILFLLVIILVVANLIILYYKVTH